MLENLIYEIKSMEEEKMINWREFNRLKELIIFPTTVKLVDAVEIMKIYQKMEAKNEKEIKRAQKKKRVYKTM